MNRVRIVAISAVALGAAVVAGTQFQQSTPQPVSAGQTMPEPAVAPVAAAAPVAETSLAALSAAAPGEPGTAPVAPGLAPDLAPDLASSDRPDLTAAPMSPSVTPAEAPARAVPPRRVAPQMASILPGEAPQQAEPPVTAASVVPRTDLANAEPAAPPQEAMTREIVERALQPAPPPFPPVETAAETGPVEPLDPQLEAEINACAVWLVVTAAPDAMLDASVYAPCDQGAQVAISHAGLTFDTHLGADGQLMTQIPALAEDASVTLTFANGRVETDSTSVPDLANVERVVLGWQGPAALALHAYEFGARFGDSGHVHAGHPMAPGMEGHGFLTVLGDPSIENAHLAQVYSYPRGESPRTGEVALEIEVPVTDASCGQTLTANSLELHGGAAGQVRAIRLDMPACDGAGGYVVLPGVLPELQIAQLQ